MHIAWDQVLGGDLTTLGYSVEMLLDDDTWIEVFSASTNPDAFETVVYGLVTGKLYTFRAFSYNFNGPSLPSNQFPLSNQTYLIILCDDTRTKIIIFSLQILGKSISRLF